MVMKKSKAIEKTDKRLEKISKKITSYISRKLFFRIFFAIKKGRTSAILERERIYNKFHNYSNEIIDNAINDFCKYLREEEGYIVNNYSREIEVIWEK